MRLSQHVFKIQIISSAGIFIKYVEAQEFSIGRSEEADVSIQFNGISRKHITIAGSDGHIYIKDNNSKYGTSIDGKKINPGEYVLYKTFSTLQFVGVNDVIVIMRLVPRIEVGLLQQNANPDFVNRLVKNTISTAVNQWVQHQVDKSGGEDSVLTNLRGEEMRALASLNKMLADAHNVADGIEKNATKESELMLDNSKRIGEKLKEKSLAEAESLLSEKKSLILEMYDREKKKITESSIEAKIKSEQMLAAAKAEAEELLSNAKATSEKLTSETKVNVEQSIANAVAQTQKIVNDANAKSTQVLSESRTTAERIIAESNALAAKTIGDAQSKSEQLLSEATLKAEQIETNANFEKNEVLEKAEAEARRLGQIETEKIISNAKQKADLLMELATEKAEKQAADLLSIANDKKNEIEQSIEEKNKELNDIIANRSKVEEDIRLECERKIEHAKQRVQIIERQTAHKSRLINLLSQKKIRQTYKALMAQMSSQKNEVEEQIKIRLAETEARIQSQYAEHESLIQREREEWLGKLHSLKEDILAKSTEQEKLNQSILELQGRNDKLINEVRVGTEKAERLHVQNRVVLEELQQIEDQRKESLRLINEQLEAARLELTSITSKSAEASRKHQSTKVEIESLEKNKVKLEEELKQLNHDIPKMKELAQAEADSYSQKVRVEADAYAAKIHSESEKRKTEFDLLMQKREADALKNMQEIKLAEEKNIADMRVESERRIHAEFEEKRRNLDLRIKNEIKGLLEHVKFELTDFFKTSALGDNEKTDLTQRTLNVIDRAIRGDSLSTENQVQDMFMFDEKQKQSRQNFWKRTKVMTSAAVIFGILLFVFSEQVSQMWQSAQTYLKSDKQDEYAREYLHKQQEAMKFRPTMTSDFKSNYTQNIIFTTHYLELENDDEYRKAWILKLNDFFEKDLKLNDTVLVKFNSAEVQLIKEIEGLSKGINAEHEQEAIARITEKEKVSVENLKTLLGGEANYEKFWEFKKQTFMNYELNRIPSNE